MNEELAFLKYRREVVRTWPDSPRKMVFLIAIESRMNSMQQKSRTISTVKLRPALT
ncbi:MAG: hypothetical protein ABSG65_20870 [Bryobacteraceae bacterium]|jgi:hypothetical protein